MNLLVLLALDAAHIVALQAELQRFDNYDIVKYEISVDPREDGADVVCDVSIRVKRDGPVRFLLSPRAGTPSPSTAASTSRSAACAARSKRTPRNRRSSRRCAAADTSSHRKWSAHDTHYSP